MNEQTQISKPRPRGMAQNRHLSSAVFHLERACGLAAMGGLGAKSAIMADFAALRAKIESELQRQAVQRETTTTTEPPLY